MAKVIELPVVGQAAASFEAADTLLSTNECRCRTCKPWQQPGSFPYFCCRVHSKHLAETIVLTILGALFLCSTLYVNRFDSSNSLRNETSGLLFTVLLFTYIPIIVGGTIVGLLAPEKSRYFAPGRFRTLATLLGVGFWLALAAPQLACMVATRGLEGEILEKLGASSPTMAAPTPFSLSAWMFQSTSSWGPYGSRGGDFLIETHTYMPNLEFRKNDCEGNANQRPWTGNLGLDVYFPTQRQALAPIIFFFHGGAWRFRGKEFIKWSPAYFLDRGFAVVSVEYTYVCWGFTVFEMVEQLASAFDQVRANATSWGFDKDRIFLSGASAGGQLAILLAHMLNSPVCGTWRSCGIKGVLDLYGVKDIIWPEFVGRGIFTELTNSSSREDWERACPVHIVSESSPPTVTVQGTWDYLVLFRSSMRFHDKMEEHGAKHLLVGLPTFGHDPEAGFWGAPAQIHRFVLERFLALDAFDDNGTMSS